MYTGPSCLGDFVEKTQSVIWMQTSAASMVNVYDTPLDTTKGISLFKKATSYSHLAIYILYILYIFIYSGSSFKRLSLDRTPSLEREIFTTSMVNTYIAPSHQRTPL